MDDWTTPQWIDYIRGNWSGQWLSDVQMVTAIE